MASDVALKQFEGAHDLLEYYDVELCLITEMLGTVARNQEMYDYHAKSKAVKEAARYGKTLTEEQIALEESTVSEQFLTEKGWTGFHYFEGQPAIYSYVIGGFLKEAIGGLRRSPKSLCKKLSAYKKVVDQQAFAYPYLIPLVHPTDLPDVLEARERPLRGSTPKGERVTLVKSDVMPPGSILRFELHVFKGSLSKELLKEVFGYGVFKGLGQWRSGSKGRFVATKFESIEKPQYSPYDIPWENLP